GFPERCRLPPREWGRAIAPGKKMFATTPVSSSGSEEWRPEAPCGAREPCVRSEVEHDSVLRSVLRRGPELHAPLSTSSFYSRNARSAMKYPPPMQTLSVLSGLLFLAATSGAAPPRGFLPDSAAAQMRWEEQYVALPDAAVIRENDRQLSAEPHHLGSAGDEK